MASRTLISVEEYLRTSYRPRFGAYVDGEVLERNVGEKSSRQAAQKAILPVLSTARERRSSACG